MVCVVNFVFALSQLQCLVWGWPSRREPDDEHSLASQGRGDIFLFKISFYVYCIGTPIPGILYFVFDSASELERWALLPFWDSPALACFLSF